MRYVVAATLAKRISDNVLFGKYVAVLGWEELELGQNVSIHRNAYIDATGGIVIGDNVSIAHDVSLISFEHGYEDLGQPIKYNRLKLRPILIEEDVWIGCGARILSGVTIGRRSIVGAGAVVVSDIPSGSVVGGVPAKVLKKIPVPPR
ncbi:MAG: DapH/DapD/GlmU-related protein [Nitrospiraceae bacterium]